VTLNVTMVSVSVRTGRLPHVQPNPSAMSRRTRLGPSGRSSGGSTMRETSSAPSTTNTACAKKGHALPAAKRPAPTAGPTSWFIVSPAAIIRALPMPRSRFSTTIGSSVWTAVSAKTSAVPSANMVARTTPMFALPVSTAAVSTTSVAARTRSTVTTSSRRSTRSARTPAYKPNSSHGSRCSRPASATSSGSEVCEATSSGPAARASPSPRLLTQAEPTSQRNGVPMRAGRKASSTLLTRTRAYETGSTQSEDIPGPGAGRCTTAL